MGNQPPASRKIVKKKIIVDPKIVLQKHRHNLCEILKCSNATVIYRKGKIGYMCNYCTDEYLEADDLKMHTIDNHGNEDPLGFAKNMSLSSLIVKLDITGLACSLCKQDINSLQELIEHLIEIHNKVIHTDIDNHIVPFKFDANLLKCCICFCVFDKYKILQEHMHKHYSNYVCDVCGSGYVFMACLTRHNETHRTGSFPCTFCDKVFDTLSKKRMHIRSIHTHTNSTNRCGYCFQGFKHYWHKEEHLAEVHGVVRPINKCNACDKSFKTTRKLTIHVKRDHLMERRHKCTVCDMKFFRINELSHHMVTHTGARAFKCELCLKTYGRKSTLRAHMRIHANDRRFKCEHCGQTFVQKCSLQSHLKSRHGDIVLISTDDCN